MRAIESLEREHELILQALTAFEVWLHHPAGDSSDKLELRKFLEVFRLFVDSCHAAKEETILFDALGDHGMPIDEGPIAVMVREHDQGRALLAALGDLARRAAPWDVGDRAQVAKNVRAYAQLMRRHIAKENTILYPLAVAQLPDHVLDSLAERFEAFEERRGRNEHERLHALTESLVGRYASGSEIAGAHAPD